MPCRFCLLSVSFLRLLSICAVFSGLFLFVQAARPDDSDEAPTDSSTDSTLLIDGIIVNPTGGGIEGAHILIETSDSAADAPPLIEAQSGPRGSVEIRLPRPPHDTLRVRVRSEGMAEYVGELDISDPDEPPFLDVTLHGAMVIAGRIRALDDTPIAGVTIRCYNDGRSFATQSDDTGHYRLDSASPGPAKITVTAEGWATQSQSIHIDDDDATLDFTLEPDRPVALAVVTNNGTPASDVFVEAYTEPDQHRLTATTDEHGQCALNGLSSDTVALRLRLNGDDYVNMREYAGIIMLPEPTSGQKRTTSRPAPVEARLTIILAGRITGHVTDAATGEPVSGVRILAGRQLRSDMPIDFTGPAGTYELVGVRPGIVAVTFQHDDYATAFAKADVHTGKSTELDVKLEHGQPVGGVVVDETGLPVDQVRVSADDWRGFQTLGLRAITGEDGKFLFPHAPTGEIGFSFVKPGYGEPRTAQLAVGRSDHFITLLGAAEPTPAAPSLDRSVRIALGEVVPDLVMTGLDGTKYRLSELRGKYIILDCWASWCGPCMAELPHVRAVHELVRERTDALLIGISLDTHRKNLDKVMQAKGMTWPQIFGPKSGASEAFETLDGVGIPYICVIAPDGKMAAQHLRGPEMVEQVREFLATKGPAGTRPAGP